MRRTALKSGLLAAALVWRQNWSSLRGRWPHLASSEGQPSCPGLRYEVRPPTLDDLFLALAEERGYDLAACYAYSDSATDIPMLEAVGHPHVVNPDRELRKLAASRAWPVLTFSKPVTLRSRVPLPPPKPTLAALAVGGVVAMGAVVWVGVRRRNVNV